MKHNNIVIVVHKNVTQPDDELVFYLNNKKYANILHICHSIYDVPNRKSYYTWYKNGKLYKRAFSFDFKHFPEPIIYLKEVIYTFIWIMKTNLTWDTYIGMDGLCVYVGNTLRLLKKVNKTIYWAIDFVPHNRFPSGIANKIYTYINTLGYKKSDEMWDLSPRMVKAREKYVGIKKSDYKKIKVVEYGMWIGRIKHVAFTQCEQHTVVFMGRLIENQGSQLVIDAMPRLIKKDPLFHYKIIGTGPFIDDVKKYAQKLGVITHCTFLGRIEDHRQVEKEIAHAALAVAPYIKKLDKWTYYADPGKVKTYLACGVPVLLTDLPWNAQEIEEHKAGKIITEDIADITKSILYLLDKKRNQIYRNNALVYAKRFDYDTLFKSLDL